MKKNSSFVALLCTDYPVICSFIAILLLGLFSAFSMWLSGKFYYLDTDCYTRYLRIIDWIKNDFPWKEKIFPFTNCPYGEVLHFTRINDVIWLIFSLPFMAILPIKEAIFTGGLIFSPIMFFLALSVLIYTLKKSAGKKDFIAPSPFIFIFAVIFLSKSMVFEFGRPDHHSLMLLITVFLMFCLSDITPKKMFFAGIIASLGIWASSAFEGMLLAYAVLAILCTGIFFFRHSFDYAYNYTFGLFVGTLLAYGLNPPFEGYLYFDNARLSLIHVVICGLTCAIFFVGNRLNPRKFSSQFLILFFGTIISVAAVISIFGFETIFAPIFKGKVAQYFAPYISEMKPTLPSECPYFIFGSIEILLLYRLFKRKSFSDIAVYSLFFFYLPIAAFIRRFLAYEILFYVLITSFMLIEIFKRLNISTKYRLSALSLIVINLAFAVSFYYDDKPVQTDYPELKGCALTNIFIAPRLIYETGINTVGSPYHNNIDGITDAIEIFLLSDENLIKKELKKRKITYIIVPNKKEGINLDYLKKAPKNSLYKTLINGKKYDWLEPMEKNNSQYVFYKIIR